MMKKGRPTITDVARAAGVSVGTVSNFLNGTVPVKAETAEKIQATIQKLAYRPSVFARSLPMIGGIVFSIFPPRMSIRRCFDR